MEATGFVTAGGQSSRMGRDKAWLPLDGRPMIEHVIAALRPATTSIAIIANGEEYRKLGLPVFCDSHHGVGPLEAIRTALAGSPTSHLILVGCDLPFVTPELFALLLDKIGDYEVAVPMGPDGMLEPLCAAYSTAALETATSLIAGGERKVSRLFDTVRTRLVPFSEINDLRGSELFFTNVNTPEEYDRAVRMLGAAG